MPITTAHDAPKPSRCKPGTDHKDVDVIYECQAMEEQGLSCVYCQYVNPEWVKYEKGE